MHAHARTCEINLARTEFHSLQMLLHVPEMGRGIQEEAGDVAALPGSPSGRSVSPSQEAPGAQPCPAPAPETQTMSIP